MTTGLSNEDMVLRRFDQNVVAVAGAGTGKTYRLTSLYTHLVLGETCLISERGGRSNRRVPASRILATTFTRDAAEEMRERVDRRLRWLVGLQPQAPWEKTGSRGEALEQSAWLGDLLMNEGAATLPTDVHSLARLALSELPHAPITTLHAFAADLLRAYPFEADVPAEFSIIQPRATRELIERSVSRELETRMGDPSQRRRLVLLLRVFPSRSALSAAVETLVQTMREEGVDQSEVRLCHHDDRSEVIEQVMTALDGLVEVLPEHLWRRPGREHRARVARAREALSEARARAPALLDLLRSARNSCVESDLSGRDQDALIQMLDANRASFGDLGDWLAEVLKPYGHVRRQGVVRIREKIAALLGARSSDGLPQRLRHYAESSVLGAIGDLLAGTVRQVALAVAVSLAASKRKLGVLDFSDIMFAARNLLRDHPLVQREVAQRFDAILVDEFQDTNRVQRDLVYLLHQRPGDIDTRPAGQAVDPRTLRPKGLLLVGDRKQSIYGFRGADVAVFQSVCLALCGKAAEQGLGLAPLSDRSESPVARWVSLHTNRRSAPSLLEALNTIAAVDMQPDENDVSAQHLRPAERLTFTPDEQLHPPDGANPGDRRARLHIVRPVTTESSVQLQRSAGIPHLVNAAVVAHLIEALHRPRSTSASSLALWETTHGGEAGAAYRPLLAEGLPARELSELAVLVRSYRAARPLAAILDEMGIPFMFGGGGGLLASTEFLDLVALARLLADPCDRLALVEVLRGPMVCVTDATLLILAWKGAKKPRLPQPSALADLSAWLDPGRLSMIPPHERARVERFGSAVVEASRHKARLGARGMLQSVLDIVGFEHTLAALPRANQRIANVRAVLQETARASLDLQALIRLSDRADTEIETPVMSHDDDSGARVMTIHGSKGLEFPVVILMQASSAVPQVRNVLQWSRSAGGLEIALDTGPGSGGAFLRQRQLAREWAERQRLSYVALTRAREELFITGSPLADSSADSPATLWSSIEKVLPALVDRGLADELTVPANLPPVRATIPPFPTQQSPSAASEKAAAVAALRLPAPDDRDCSTQESILVVTEVADFAVCPRRFELKHVRGLDEETLSDSPSRGRACPLLIDPRSKGQVLHRVLEEFARRTWQSPRSARQILDMPVDTNDFTREVLGEMGLGDEGVDELARLAGVWTHGEYARELTRQIAEDLAEALPEVEFLVPLGIDGLHIKGTMDLVVLHRDEATSAPREVEVWDYKSGGVERKSTRPMVQLAAYRWAASRLWPEATSHRARSVVLDTGAVSEVPRDQGDWVKAAQGLLRARAHGGFSFLEDSGECEAHNCGYVCVCFPGPKKVSGE